MKLVVDTNVLFTFFWKNSITRKLLLQQQLELYSPEYALEELNEHSDEICLKSKITKTQFKQLKEELVKVVFFVSVEDYSSELKKCTLIINDLDDIDFLALASKLNTPLWSNDSDLKKQSVVSVISTKELLSLLELLEQ